MRHDKNRGSSRPLAAALTVMAGIVLATAACGGGGTSAASGASASATSPHAHQLAFSRCMRKHGVPKFPDPNGNGQLKVDTSALGVSTSVLQAASQACGKSQPGHAPGGGGQAGKNSAQDAAQALKFAKCLRKHGVPNFPDPKSDGSFTVPSSINMQSPTFKAATNACQSDMPGQLNISSGGAS